jgi:methylmalonyl-CoA mutase cobalamin-binding subunit
VVYDILVERMRSFAARPDSPRVLVATPVGERHAIGAAIVGAGAATHGCGVIFLGTDLPATHIVTAAIASNVSAVAMSVVYVEDRARTVSELKALRSQLPANIPLFIGGAGAGRLSRDLSGSGIRITDNVDELYEDLRRANGS